MVVLIHTQTGGVFRTTTEAYEQVWEPKGWVLADSPDGQKALAKKTKEELLELAGEYGIEADPAATKTAIAAGVAAPKEEG